MAREQDRGKMWHCSCHVLRGIGEESLLALPAVRNYEYTVKDVSNSLRKSEACFNTFNSITVHSSSKIKQRNDHIQRARNREAMHSDK